MSLDASATPGSYEGNKEQVSSDNEIITQDGDSDDDEEGKSDGLGQETVSDPLTGAISKRKPQVAKNINTYSDVLINGKPKKMNQGKDLNSPYRNSLRLKVSC